MSRRIHNSAYFAQEQAPWETLGAKWRSHMWNQIKFATGAEGSEKNENKTLAFTKLTTPFRSASASTKHCSTSTNYSLPQMPNTVAIPRWMNMNLECTFWDMLYKQNSTYSILFYQPFLFFNCFSAGMTVRPIRFLALWLALLSGIASSDNDDDRRVCFCPEGTLLMKCYNSTSKSYKIISQQNDCM